MNFFTWFCLFDFNKLFYITDIPVHTVQVLPKPRSSFGNPLRPGNRHVVVGVHTGGDAHR